MDSLVQRVTQFLWGLVLVGAQLLVLVGQNLHESMSSICQVQQMLNRGLCTNFVAAEFPKYFLLVVIRLNILAEFVDLERVNRHPYAWRLVLQSVLYRWRPLQPSSAK